MVTSVRETAHHIGEFHSRGIVVGGGLMDPVSLVVAAVVAGAVSGVKDTATQVVKDTYAGLKQLLERRKVELAALEAKPASPVQRAALEETLSDSLDGADPADVERLLDAARAVIEAVRDDPAAGEASRVIGVDLADVEAEAIRLRNIASSGGGARIQGAKVTGEIEIDGVTAGLSDPADPQMRQ
jgi:hypothetical protein